MGKVKNLEKVAKPAPQFDAKKGPKTMKNEKVKKNKALKDKLKKNSEVLTKTAKKNVATANEVPKLVTGEGSFIARDVMKKAVKGVKSGLDKEKENQTKQDLFDEEIRIGLQVIAVKIPKTPPHTKKILLTHSLFDTEPDICFIIRDNKMKKDNVEETIMKFQEILQEAGVTNVKTIIPISKLKKDYGPNNMKMKLLNTYDVFLVESEIAEHTYTILGKHFIQKRKRPHQIDVSKKETMKSSIENATRKVSFKLSFKSNFSIFEIGTYKMENSKIVDNIASALEQLKTKWPGSLQNVMRLYLKPMRQSKVSIPLYYSNIDPNEVSVPVEKGVKQTRLDKINEMLLKKSKKLQIDKKTKKVVKVKGEAPKKSDKNTKALKTNVDESSKADEGESEVSVEQPKKKKHQIDNLVPEGKKKKNEKITETLADQDVTSKIKKDTKRKSSALPTEVESIESTALKKKKKSVEDPQDDSAHVKKQKKVKATAPTELTAKPAKNLKKKKLAEKQLIEEIPSKTNKKQNKVGEAKKAKKAK